jgi:hypothetical protein
MKLVFKCSADNDLFRVLKDMGFKYPRFTSPAKAIDQAPEGSAVLSLADEYPRPADTIDEKLLDRAAEKKLRMFIEYPASLPGLALGEPRPTLWERAVTSSDFFGPALPNEQILAMHGCWFLPVEVEKPHLVVARLAGYRKSAYGLPKESYPILFELPGRDVLVATSKISQFVTARYAPKSDWKNILERILRWLAPGEEIPCLEWTPTVALQSDRDTPLPKKAQTEALKRSTRWFREEVVFSHDHNKGAIEGYESYIDYLGRQKKRVCTRGDCTAETGMAIAYDFALTKNPDSRQLAGQIFDYVWSAPNFYQDDPKSPAYGLNNWFDRGPVFYGDDNARVILPTLAGGRLLQDDRWDEKVLRCLLGNLRTTGRLGFRESSLQYPESFKDGKGWQFYRDQDTVHYAPHYQGYLWACNIWAYGLTGYEGFLKNTRTGIRMMMEAYPGKITWTNGITQEMARMLLPLAFLLRVEDTAEHRQWLDRVAGDVLGQMQPCGAIREMMGSVETGAYPSPRSNESYGTTEASLIQENGDPACDLLYTTNFAYLGLHEAAAVTGDPKLKEAENRLTDFLCRIQVRSTAQPYLDGAWMRAFDYELWEYYASSSDLGWAAWSIESGWTNSWINAVLAMRQLKESLFDLATADRLKKKFPALLDEMFEGNPL